MYIPRLQNVLDRAMKSQGARGKSVSNIFKPFFIFLKMPK